MRKQGPKAEDFPPPEQPPNNVEIADGEAAAAGTSRTPGPDTDVEMQEEGSRQATGGVVVGGRPLAGPRVPLTAARCCVQEWTMGTRRLPHPRRPPEQGPVRHRQRTVPRGPSRGLLIRPWRSPIRQGTARSVGRVVVEDSPAFCPDPAPPRYELLRR